jgi:conjugal transfer pilus assembly protein TraL
MTRIARYIDDPPSFFLWEIDEVVVFALFIGIGIFLHSLLVFMAIGTASAYLLGKVKQTRAEGFFLHMLYWHGILPLRGCAPSYFRTLVE